MQSSAHWSQGRHLRRVEHEFRIQRIRRHPLVGVPRPVSELGQTVAVQVAPRLRAPRVRRTQPGVPRVHLQQKDPCLSSGDDHKVSTEASGLSSGKILDSQTDVFCAYGSLGSYQASQRPPGNNAMKTRFSQNLPRYELFEIKFETNFLQFHKL